MKKKQIQWQKNEKKIKLGEKYINRVKKQKRQRKIKKAKEIITMIAIPIIASGLFTLTQWPNITIESFIKFFLLCVAVYGFSLILIKSY